MNTPLDQSLDYMDGWCVGWDRERRENNTKSKTPMYLKAILDGKKARKHLSKEIERRNKNKKALNKMINKGK